MYDQKKKIIIVSSEGNLWNSLEHRISLKTEWSWNEIKSVEEWKEDRDIEC